MTDNVCPEDDCPVCSRIAPVARSLFRMDVFCLPLREPICVKCLVAFWRNIGLPVVDDEGPTLN